MRLFPIHNAVPLLVLASTCPAETIDAILAPKTTLASRLESGLVPQTERQAVIRKIFERAGCAVEEQKVDKKSSNVVCTLPGETDSTIVVGGHFDFVSAGRGIVDDWSGTSLLPSLFESMKSKPRKHTFIFVAFAAEEGGLFGSKRYVKNLSPVQRGKIAAFINLECLGLSPVKVWAHRSSPLLVSRLRGVAYAMKIPLEGVDVDRVGDDDTHPFLEAKIPVLSLHSVSQDTLRILHSPRDRIEAVDPDLYFTAYRLTAFYLAYLDLRSE